MKDDVLNSFIKKLLNEELEEKKIELYVDIFSQFLGYTNVDYKYNGTYLGQYISDFIQVHQMLKKKSKKYQDIFDDLSSIGYDFELLVDESFFSTFLLNEEKKSEYVGINSSKIVSSKIEIKVKIKLNNKEYIFCKEYDDFEEKKLSKIILHDVETYIKMKKIRRTSDETS